MGRLTEAQTTLLRRASQYTALLYDGVQAATADRLVGKGFGSRIPKESSFGFFQITEAGRTALREATPEQGERE